VTSEEAVLAVIDALEAARVPYMVVGSLSSNLYGMPRSTQDADFVVQVEPSLLAALRTRLGPPFRWEPQLSFEAVTATTRQIIEVGSLGFRIELFLLSDDLHDQQRFARRKRVQVLGQNTYAPTAEDVIVTKLRWSQQGRRHKDLDDVRNVLAVQGEYLDWPYLQRWCDQHGTRTLLEEIRRSIPPL
jgi:hypothetical protein